MGTKINFITDVLYLIQQDLCPGGGMASGSGHQPALAITISENDADEFCGVLSCRKQKAPVQIKLKRRILSPLQLEYSLIFILFLQWDSLVSFSFPVFTLKFPNQPNSGSLHIKSEENKYSFFFFFFCIGRILHANASGEKEKEIHNL
ncbi:hypothetical protein NC651_016231 [Populus alba x Populus x berolinensis]|nr:hypothetical protein NC651_016231 [Populus alba x Populus x berolinensis]